MSRSISGKIKINSFADIVGGDDTAVTEVPIADLHEFKDHPFKLRRICPIYFVSTVRYSSFSIYFLFFR